MDKLPAQLRWEEFVAVLEYLKYKQLPNKRGAARHFQGTDGKPVTFHEPHGGSRIPQGTLSENLRKLNITREEFAAALEKKRGSANRDDEHFKRVLDTDGTIISNCLKCYEVVAKSMVADNVAAAEESHPCWLDEGRT